MRLEICNRASVLMNVVLEPIGDSFDIPPETIAEIELGNKESARIDIYSDNRANIWTEGNVTVTIGENKLEFSAMM